MHFYRFVAIQVPRFIWLLVILGLLALFPQGVLASPPKAPGNLRLQVSAPPTPTPTPTATPVPTPRPTVTASITPTPTPTPIPGPTIQVDVNWLDQHGPAPYYLDQADTTYLLQTDMTTSGTAFIVLNQHVTFNLNGHTITYDTAVSPTVPNGGFESGTSPTNIPGWDVSQAPSATRVPALGGMWGNWMCQLANITGTQTMKSSNISIPQANIAYVASMWCSGNRYASQATLTVFDSVTHANLGSVSLDPTSGVGMQVGFTPTATNAVYFQVTLSPGTNPNATFNLDHASLARTGYYGVNAQYQSGTRIISSRQEAASRKVRPEAKRLM